MLIINREILFPFGDHRISVIFKVAIQQSFRKKKVQKNLTRYNINHFAMRNSYICEMIIVDSTIFSYRYFPHFDISFISHHYWYRWKLQNRLKFFKKGIWLFSKNFFKEFSWPNFMQWTFTFNFFILGILWMLVHTVSIVSFIQLQVNALCRVHIVAYISQYDLIMQ